MSCEKFWDFEIKIEKFIAHSVLNIKNYEMSSNENIFINGRFSNKEIMQNIDNYLFFNFDKVIACPTHKDMPSIDMIEWLSLRKNTSYSIKIKSIIGSKLLINIRLFNIEDAYKFRLQYDSYIIFKKG